MAKGNLCPCTPALCDLRWIIPRAFYHFVTWWENVCLMGIQWARHILSGLKVGGGEFYDGVKGIFLPDGRFSSPVKDLSSVEDCEQPSLGARWGWGGRSGALV